MEPHSLTLLSHGLIVYLLAPVIILLLVSIHKESRELKRLKGILWFGAAMMALCAAVILFTTLHRGTALGKIKSNRSRTVTGPMNLCDLLILNLTVQVFDAFSLTKYSR